MQLTVVRHRTTLLHDVAWEEDVRKARLLLEHGADINAVDDEFRSTPLALINRIVWPGLAGSAWYTFGLSGQRSPWPDDSS